MEFFEHDCICKYYVDAEISTLNSVFDRLSFSIFCRNMEKRPPTRKGMVANGVYLPPALAFFSFVTLLSKCFSFFCTSTWGAENHVSSQGNGTNRRNEGANNLFVALMHVTGQQTKRTIFFQLFKPPKLKLTRKTLIQSLQEKSCCANIFPSSNGNIMKKRKLAAVSRNSQDEYPRKNSSRDTNVHRVNEDYITQDSEEIVKKWLKSCLRSSAQ